MKLTDFLPKHFKTLREYQENRTTSDIDRKWKRPRDITEDVRKYLMGLYEEGEDDFVLQDTIAAIEKGIKEFRETTEI